MSESLAVLLYAIQHNPAAVHLVDFADLVTRARVVKRHHQQDGQRITSAVGVITADVPAMVARALKAPPGERDYLLLAHMRREAHDELVGRMESGIILPGDVVRM